MKYVKPHLSFNEQVEHLRRRGLVVDDAALAASLLRTVGYYRLSAYAYPLRAMLPNDAKKDTPWQHRSDQFLPGATIELVRDLWQFDRELRLLLFDAIESVEVALRVQIAYVLGKRSPFGHVEREHLDPRVCNEPTATADTRWEVWHRRYLAALAGAKSEDFVRHFDRKYEGQLPVWVATEIMDFGMLVQLFGFLRGEDKNSIGTALGVPAGTVLARWFGSVNYVRNLCAHHSRLWNRRLTYTVARQPGGLVPELEHLRAQNETSRKKVYAVASVISHITRSIEPSTKWPTRFGQAISTFPENPFVSPTTDMGFPINWPSMQVWRS